MAIILKFPDRDERATIRIEGDHAIAQLDGGSKSERSAETMVVRHGSESLPVAQLRAGLNALTMLEAKLGRTVKHRWSRWPPAGK